MKRLKCLRSMVAMVLLLGMSSLSAQNCDYPGNYAKAPRFKALLCYSETAEPAHVEFGHQAEDFFKDLTVGNGYLLDVATSFSGYDYDKLAAYDVVIAINTVPGSKGERDAFEEYMESGGGWMGFHAAGYNDASTKWPWFNQFLCCGSFLCNIWRRRSALLDVNLSNHSVTKNLPVSFSNHPVTKTLPVSCVAPKNEC